MGAWIMRKDSVFTVTTDPDGTPVEIPSMCEYVKAIRLTSSPTESDASTMCKSQTLVGNPTHSCVLAVVWSPEFYDAVKAYVGEECEFYYQADANMETPSGWKWRGTFSYVPFGASELGEAIIPDWTVSVLADPEFAAPTP